jgi:transcriptional antiterminator NusG
MEEKKWYVVHTYSGQENKVKANLEKRLAALGLRQKVGQILVPEEQVAEIKKGKRKVTSKRFYPGYVLVQMQMEEDVWQAIRGTPGVFGFLGSKKQPTPLAEEDVDMIMEQMEAAKQQVRPKMEFEEGESVRVINGPFANFVGTVGEVNPKRQKLKVMLTVLGRPAPVELSFAEVEKL